MPSDTSTHQFTIDLAALSRGDAHRDRTIASALDSAQHPHATFALDGPVDVAELLAGEQATLETSGTLTINGVSRDTVATVTVDTVGGALVAVGQMPVTFGDFVMTLPSAPIVLSIADEGVIETQLRFLAR